MSITPINNLTPFGRHAPGALLRRVLAWTRGAGQSWLAHRRAFFLRGLSIKALAGRPVDVTSLGAKMRLYPYNNVCEKRILFTPQYFDEPERLLLKSRITTEFVFIDIGSNVGGYALYVAANAGPLARILAIEPQRFVRIAVAGDLQPRAHPSRRRIEREVERHLRHQPGGRRIILPTLDGGNGGRGENVEHKERYRRRALRFHR